MITAATPISAIEIVRHIAAGGRCIIRVIPQKHTTVIYPREVEQVRQDRYGEWWFGVTLWAFQWFQFPAVGLEWTLVSHAPEAQARATSFTYPAASGPHSRHAGGACDAAATSPDTGSQRGDSEDAAERQKCVI